MLRQRLVCSILLLTSIALFDVVACPSQAMQEKTESQGASQATEQEKSSDAQAGQTEEQKAEEDNQATLEWIEFKVPESEVVLSFPGEPKRRVNLVKPTPESEMLRVVGYRKQINKGTALFSFNQSELPEELTQTKEKMSRLEWAERNTLTTVLGKKSGKSKRIRYANNPGREYKFEFTFTNPKTKKTSKWTSLTRNYIVGQTFYEISAVQLSSKFDEELARKFISSFELKSDEKKKQ